MPKRFEPYVALTMAELLTGPARVARVLMRVREPDDRTNGQITRPLGVGENNICITAQVAYGQRTGAMKPDNLLRLADVLGLEPILPMLAALLREDTDPLSASLERRQARVADPDF